MCGSGCMHTWYRGGYNLRGDFFIHVYTSLEVYLIPSVIQNRVWRGWLDICPLVSGCSTKKTMWQLRQGSRENQWVVSSVAQWARASSNLGPSGEDRAIYRASRGTQFSCQQQDGQSTWVTMGGVHVERRQETVTLKIDSIRFYWVSAPCKVLCLGAVKIWK
jgi:hypothetical protein